jgi:hypothetical protein
MIILPITFFSDGIRLLSCDICGEQFIERIVMMMHKDINHSQQISSFVDCDAFIKEEDIKEDIKEDENVDNPSSISYSTETYIKEEIKEEVNEEQGFDDFNNLGTDNLVG